MLQAFKEERDRHGNVGDPVVFPSINTQSKDVTFTEHPEDTLDSRPRYSSRVSCLQRAQTVFIT